MAVNLVCSGKSTSEVGLELGIRSELVRRWRREFKEYQAGSFSGHGNANLTDEQKEIIKLRKELKNAEQERDILKKAVGIFSKNDGRYSNS